MSLQSGSLVVAIMAALLFKHFVFDFVLQSKKQLLNKGRYGHPAGVLHVGLHVAGSVPALLIAAPGVAMTGALLLAEGLVHYHLDWGKAQVLSRTGWGIDDNRYWALFGADQCLHGLSYVAIAWVLIGRP